MNDPDTEKPKYSGTCSRAPLSTTDLTENDLALYLGLCSLTGMEPVATKFTDCAN